MHGPVLVGWLLVVLCAATGSYCLLRMRSPVAEQRHSATGEAVMGFGMALMAVPAVVFAPPAWVWLGFAAVFGAAALHALWSARGSMHHLHHLVGALAMVYMAVVMASLPAGHAGHAGHAGVPLLTGVLLAYYGGYMLWAGARLVPAPSPTGGVVATGGPGGPTVVVAWADRTELALVCRVAMGIAMFAMLLTL